MAKAKLFKHTKVSILNADDKSYFLIKPWVVGKIITYGLNEKADFQAQEVVSNLIQSRFNLVVQQDEILEGAENKETVEVQNIRKIMLGEQIYLSYPIISQLPGEYNVSNVLAAIACGVAIKIDLATIIKSVAGFISISGRWQSIDCGQDFMVIIDFAHTSGSFEKVLPFIRKNTKGCFIHVFGCAGLRDRQKRPEMGRLSADNADLMILTAEDPRTEDVYQIIREITAGIKKDGFKEITLEEARRKTSRGYLIIPDRKEAIKTAMSLAQSRDTVFLSGKGHEQSMCLGEIEYPWSEESVVKEILNEKYGRK